MSRGWTKRREKWSVVGGQQGSVLPADHRPPITYSGISLPRPTTVYSGRFGQADYHMSDYAVAPDGKLLLIEPSERGAIASHLNVVLNWHEIVTKKKLQ